jgi:hypothetical protein
VIATGAPPTSAAVALQLPPMTAVIWHAHRQYCLAAAARLAIVNWCVCKMPWVFTAPSYCVCICECACDGSCRNTNMATPLSAILPGCSGELTDVMLCVRRLRCLLQRVTACAESVPPALLAFCLLWCHCTTEVEMQHSLLSSALLLLLRTLVQLPALPDISLLCCPCCCCWRYAASSKGSTAVPAALPAAVHAVGPFAYSLCSANLSYSCYLLLLDLC